MQFKGPTLISVLKISLPHFSFESAVYFLQFLKNKNWHQCLHYRKVLDTAQHSCLGGVVVSVLATGPKGCGFEPGQGDGWHGASSGCG
jgi:hypothetical protein